jgi:hypothetical protein
MKKAVIAQAENKKYYLDRQFRLGANTMARLKFKDSSGGCPTQRGRMQAKDPPDRGGGEYDEPGAEVENFGDEEMSGRVKGKAVVKVRERKRRRKRRLRRKSGRRSGTRRLPTCLWKVRRVPSWKLQSQNGKRKGNEEPYGL